MILSDVKDVKEVGRRHCSDIYMQKFSTELLAWHSHCRVKGRVGSEKFDVANHVFGGQQIVDQHAGSQHMGYRCRLMRIHNASMREAGCMQPKKIRILGHYHAAVLGCSFKVSCILGCLQVELLNCHHVHVAPA